MEYCDYCLKKLSIYILESRIVKEFDAIIHKHDDTSDNYLRSLESASESLKALIDMAVNKNNSTEIENRYLLGGLRRDRYLLMRQCEDSNNNDINDLKRSIANFLKNEIQIYTSLRFDCGYLSEQLSIVENEILNSVLQNHMDADKENLVDLKNCAFKVARVLEDNIIQSTANYHSTI